MFSSFDFVYRLTIAMRFDDNTLISILTKMREKGGCKLTSLEWLALQKTNVTSHADLLGTELWYESAYEWSIVSMATAVRSELSARTHHATLFVLQARDEFTSIIDKQQAKELLRGDAVDKALTEAVLRHPNMNETGRLPSFTLLHIGMSVRLTQTSEAGVAVVDATGKVVGFDFDPEEPVCNSAAVERADQPVVILRCMLRAD